MSDNVCEGLETPREQRQLTCDGVHLFGGIFERRDYLENDLGELRSTLSCRSHCGC